MRNDPVMRSGSFGRRAVLAASLGAASLALTRKRARAATTVLRIGDQIGGAQAVMQAAGVLDDLPYRLEWAQFPAAAPLLEALNAQAIDAGGAGDAPTTFGLAAGAPARIVAAYRADPWSTAMVVPADSPLRNAGDLRGKRIGTGRGSIGHALVLAALKANGMTSADVQLAFLLPADAKSALRAGSLDAWSTWDLYVTQAVEKDGNRVLVDGRGLLSGLSYQSATLDAIGGKRAALADFLARLDKARFWANVNLDAYAAQWARLVHIEERIARLNLNRQNVRPVRIDGQVVADQQRTANLWTDAGIIHHHLDVRGFFDTSFALGVPA
jgi:sulfonate transport system substrate-binding protein